MKNQLLLFAMAMSVPLWADKNPSDYPMRLQIITVSSQTNRNGTYHVGKANLLDGDTSYAVDYDGTCSFSFQSYPVSAHISSAARWKKQPYELEALFAEQEHRDKYKSCTFKIGVRLAGKAYVGQAGGYKLVDCIRGRNCPAIWSTK